MSPYVEVRVDCFAVGWSVRGPSGFRSITSERSSLGSLCKRIVHDKWMTYIDFEVIRSKAKVTVTFNIKMASDQ